MSMKPPYLPETVVAVPREDEDWMPRHVRLVERAQKGGIGLLFLGDSITEAMGDVQDLLDQCWHRFQPVPFGIGGDRTQHLLWRILHGEVDHLSPAVVAVLIGTNNLQQGEHSDTDGEVFAGVRIVVQALRAKLPYSKILIIGILPRDEDAHSPLRKRIRNINRALAGLTRIKHVYFVDVGDWLVRRDGRISADIMPDFLHLSREGYRRLYTGLAPMVSWLMGEPWFLLSLSTRFQLWLQRRRES